MNIDPKAGLSTVSTSAGYVPPSATGETAQELNKIYLKLVESSEPYPWLNSETRADDFNYSITDVQAVTALQSQAIKVISTLPTENPVAHSLAESIEKNALTLAEIQALSIGGMATFNVLVDKMLASYEGKPLPLQGIDLENLFVVALLDTVPYLTGTLNDPATQAMILLMMEVLGSGNHNTVAVQSTQALAMVSSLWSTLSSKLGTEPFGPNSTLYKAMTLINGGNPPTSELPADFRLQIMKYDDVNSGGWLTSGQDEFSPTVRIYMARDLLKNQTLTSAEIDIILSGTKTQINQLFVEKTGEDAITFLARDGKWKVVDMVGSDGLIPSGVTQVIYYVGDFTAADAEALATSFPGRELTKEDLTQINNIGDQVKMLMQTLKYWLTTVRDEQLSISRNIS